MSRLSHMISRSRAAGTRCGVRGIARHGKNAGLVAGAFLTLFLVGQAFGIESRLLPDQWTNAPRTLSAAAGVGLLLVDVVLPVPSSLVMTANGALFGVWFGAALSLAGNLGAAVIALTLGRLGGSLLTRSLAPSEQTQSFLRRWGLIAVVVSRPIPIIAETVLVLAGASPLGFWRTMGAALLGSIPASLAYAFAGAHGAGSSNVVVIFVAVVTLSGVLWLLGRRATRPATSR